MTDPLISLIVPTHHREHLLRRALQSVVQQNHSELVEIIVISDVADALTDAVANQLLRPQDTYIRRNGQPGPSQSRNLGLKLATGKYVMFLDDDDAWHPHFLSSLVARLPEITSDLVYMNCCVVKESRLATGPITLNEFCFDLKDHITDYVYVKNQVHMSCYLFAKNTLADVAFDPYLRAYEDWDFQLSIISKNKPTHLPIFCSVIYEVDDDTTDRRGSSQEASDFNATLDYLYIYRRHKAPTDEVRKLRADLLASVGLQIKPDFL